MKNGNLKAVVDGGQPTRKIIIKRGSQKFYKPSDVHSLSNAINDLRKYNFLVVKLFMGRQ